MNFISNLSLWGMRDCFFMNNKEKEYNIGKLTIWVGFANILGRLFTLLASIVTARVLFPSDFGIIAMAATVSNFIDFAGSMGIDAFIISRLEISQKHTNSIFFVNLLIALVLSITLILVAPLASNFYKCPEIRNILFFSSFSFFAATFSIIPKAFLIKEMKQEIISKIEIAKNLLLSLLIILFAISGFKYLSYVIPCLIINIGVSIFYLIITKWKFSISFDFSILRSFLNYTRSFFGKSIVLYFILNSDYMIAGYLLGKYLLGFYYFGFEKAFIIQIFLFTISNNIFFSVFSKCQNNYETLKREFYSILKKQIFFVYPFLFMLIMLSTEIFSLLYGSRWNNSILLFQIFIASSFSRSIMTIIQTLFDSTDKPDQTLKHYVSILPFFVLILYIGASLGSILGISIAAFCGYNISCFLLFKRFDNVYKFGFKRLIKSCLKPLLSLLLQLPIIIPIKLLLIKLNINTIFILAIISILIIILYLTFTHWLMPDEYKSIFIPIKLKILKKLKLIDRELNNENLLP